MLRFSRSAYAIFPLVLGSALLNKGGLLSCRKFVLDFSTLFGYNKERLDGVVVNNKVKRCPLSEGVVLVNYA